MKALDPTCTPAVKGQQRPRLPSMSWQRVSYEWMADNLSPVNHKVFSPVMGFSLTNALQQNHICLLRHCQHGLWQQHLMQRAMVLLAISLVFSEPLSGLRASVRSRKTTGSKPLLHRNGGRQTSWDGGKHRFLIDPDCMRFGQLSRSLEGLS
jgi:hypothetical protein